MRLQSVKLLNYRCYPQFEVQFDRSFNVIAGVNGSGKTSLLKGVRDVLCGYASYVNIAAGNIVPLGEPEAVRVARTETNGRFRFEPIYPIRVEAVGTAFGREYRWGMQRDGEAQGMAWLGEPPGTMLQSNAHVDGLDDPRITPLVLPLVAFYPAYRNWPPSAPNQMAAATVQTGRLQGYSLWAEASLDSQALQQWAITKSLERLQLASERGVDLDAVRDDELAQVNLAIAGVVEGAKGIRYDFVQKALLVDWSDKQKSTLFQHLSDGQRVAIALVADIARRMCMLNPHLGLEVTRKTPGVVLIDELDVHLHPKWQRVIAKGLKDAFPEVQFITTTHSPQILGELPSNEIILLTSNGVAHPEVSYGLDSSAVLEQIMGATARAADVERDLIELFEVIERLQLDDAESLLEKLRSSAPGIPDLDRAEALLARKRVLGR